MAGKKREKLEKQQIISIPLTVAEVQAVMRVMKERREAAAAIDDPMTKRVSADVYFAAQWHDVVVSFT